MENTIETVLAKLVLKDNGCLDWPNTQPGQYGTVKVRGRQWKVHKFVYERLVGPVPPGLELDHLCRNPHCANIVHLEAVTHQVNVIRGGVPAINASKTHCPAGHPYEGDNLYFRESDRGRVCRACRIIWKEKRRRERGAAIAGEKRTHCPQGHPYQGDNLYLRKDRTGRLCKACRDASSQRSLARKKESG